jgi:hypothetical protein
MSQNRKAEPCSQLDSLDIRLRLQEFVLLEVLQQLSPQHGEVLADELRARLNAWALHAWPQLKATVDAATVEQVTTLLMAMAESTRSGSRFDA